MKKLVPTILSLALVNRFVFLGSVSQNRVPLIKQEIII